MSQLLFRNDQVELHFHQHKRKLETFFQSSLGDRKILIYSIAGGEGFLRSHALRHLYSTVSQLKEFPGKSLIGFCFKFDHIKYPSSQWCSKETEVDFNEPLEGFPLNSHAIPKLTIWLDVFVHQREDGEKFAILLMDSGCLCEELAVSLIMSSHQTIDVNGSVDKFNWVHLEVSLNLLNHRQV